MVEFLFCLTVSKLLAISKDFAVVQLADCIKKICILLRRLGAYQQFSLAYLLPGIF